MCTIFKITIDSSVLTNSRACFVSAITLKGMTCLLSIALEFLQPLADRTVRAVLMHLDETFDVHVNCHCLFPLRCTWACVRLKSLHCVGRWLVVCYTWVGRQLSTPQVPWLHQRQPRELWRKRDCTLHSSSQLQRVHLRRRCVLRRRKDCTQAFLLTMLVSTSEEGQAYLLTTAACTSSQQR